MENMENVSSEMKHFFAACEMLMEKMSPRDFSDSECKLIEHYGLELYVKYARRRSVGHEHQPPLNQVDLHSSSD